MLCTSERKYEHVGDRTVSETSEGVTFCILTACSASTPYPIVRDCWCAIPILWMDPVDIGSASALNADA